MTSHKYYIRAGGFLGCLFIIIMAVVFAYLGGQLLSQFISVESKVYEPLIMVFGGFGGLVTFIFLYMTIEQLALEFDEEGIRWYKYFFRKKSVFKWEDIDSIEIDSDNMNDTPYLYLYLKSGWLAFYDIESVEIDDLKEFEELIKDYHQQHMIS